MKEQPKGRIKPDLDSTSGKSYEQVHQTPGALGGRRAVQRWHNENGKVVKVAGAAWRLIEACANVSEAPSVTISLNILAKLPGQSYESIFSVQPSVQAGQFTSTGGVIRGDKRILPIGTLVGLGQGTGASGLYCLTQYGYNDGLLQKLADSLWSGFSTVPAGGEPLRELKFFDGAFYAIKDLGSSGFGSLLRAEVGGAWVEVLSGLSSVDGVRQISQGVDGTLWAVWGKLAGGDYRWIIYKSIDGVTWDIAYTVPGSTMIGLSIACSPSEEGVVASIGSSGASFIQILYTDDNGVSWNVVSPSPVQLPGSSAIFTQQLRVGLSSRLIWAAASPLIRISDNWGLSWTTKLTASTGGVIYNAEFVQGDSAGVLYYAWHYASGGSIYGFIARSLDNGDSWEEQWAESSVLFGDTLSRFEGVDWDHSLDRLNVVSYKSSPSPSVIVAQWAEAGGWADITFNFDDIADNRNPIIRGLRSGAPVLGEEATIELHYRTQAVAQ